MLKKLVNSFPAAILLVLAACSLSKNQNEETTSTTDNSESIPEEPGNIFYADFVFQFEDTGELYIPLHFKVENNYDVFDLVAASADSVIAANEELKRSRIPIQIAQKYFDLNNIAELLVFNEYNENVGSASFVRAEFLEGLIDNEFIAVYKPASPNTDYLYCTAIHPPVTNPVKIVSDENNSVRRRIIDLLHLNENSIWSMAHYNLEEDKKYLTVLFADTTSYILEGSKEPKILYKSNEAEAINEKVILPIRKNGYPILLISFARPDTDMFWTSVLFFDGSSYKAAPHNRISLE